MSNILGDEVGFWVNVKGDLGVDKLLLRRSLDLVKLSQGELDGRRFLYDQHCHNG